MHFLLPNQRAVLRGHTFICSVCFYSKGKAFPTKENTRKQHKQTGKEKNTPLEGTLTPLQHKKQHKVERKGKNIPLEEISMKPYKY